jgi:hypothetical protein
MEELDHGATLALNPATDKPLERMARAGGV